MDEGKGRDLNAVAGACVIFVDSLGIVIGLLTGVIGAGWCWSVRQVEWQVTKNERNEGTGSCVEG